MRIVDKDDKTAIPIAPADNDALAFSIYYPFILEGNALNHSINKEAFKTNIKELLELAGNQKRNEERIKSSRKFAVGISIVTAIGVAAGIIYAIKCGKETRDDLKNKAVKTVKSIKNTAQKKAETVNDSTAHVAQKVSDVTKDVHGKSEDVKEDAKDGYQDVKQDIHRAAENVSDDLK